MDLPTIEEARAVKREMIARFRDHEDFLGAGIGQRDGRWMVRVNWRRSPQGLHPPSRIRNVEIGHFHADEPRLQAD